MTTYICRHHADDQLDFLVLNRPASGGSHPGNATTPSGEVSRCTHVAQKCLPESWQVLSRYDATSDLQDVSPCDDIPQSVCFTLRHTGRMHPDAAACWPLPYAQVGKLHSIPCDSCTFTWTACSMRAGARKARRRPCRHQLQRPDVPTSPSASAAAMSSRTSHAAAKHVDT